MNIGYFVVLLSFLTIFQIPCFLLLLVAFPARILLGHQYLTNLCISLLMKGAYWTNKVFFKMTMIVDPLVDKKKKYVRMANHSSFIDAIIISEISHNSMTIVIDYAKFCPLLGWNIAMIGIPFIGAKGGTGITQMYTKFLNDPKNKDMVLSLFPTGTRFFTDDDLRVTDLKSGGFVIAKNLGLDIIPMYHNLVDAFNDVKMEYNPTPRLFCIQGAPISIEGKDIEQLKIEYHEAQLKLRAKVQFMKNRILN